MSGTSSGPASSLGGVALAWALCLTACSDVAQPASYQAPRGVDQVMVGMSTELIHDGQRTLRVEADSAFYETGSNVRTLVGVEARAFSESGLVRTTLEADSGVLEEGDRVFMARGNVSFRTRNGSLTVETSELVYDPATNLLRSDSETVVDQRGRTQRVPCFESDPFLTSWRVCGAGS